MITITVIKPALHTLSSNSFFFISASLICCCLSLSAGAYLLFLSRDNILMYKLSLHGHVN